MRCAATDRDAVHGPDAIRPEGSPFLGAGRSANEGERYGAGRGDGPVFEDETSALATDGHFGAGAEDAPVQAVLVQAAQRLGRGVLARLELRDDLVAVIG